MQKPGIVRAAAAAALLTLLGAGCTPAPAPQPTPTPATASPPETAQEREQRLAYAAAEDAYRTNRSNYQKVLQSGGASKPSPTMTATSAGPYLAEISKVAQAFHGFGYHREGSETTLFLRPNGYSPTSISLSTCLDTRGVTIRDRSGKKIGAGELRKLTLEVRLIGSSWKVWTGQGGKVDSCE